MASSMARRQTRGLDGSVHSSLGTNTGLAKITGAEDLGKSPTDTASLFEMVLNKALEFPRVAFPARRKPLAPVHPSSWLMGRCSDRLIFLSNSFKKY